jgi:transcriptional regulator with XRE-family HTH domain
LSIGAGGPFANTCQAQKAHILAHGGMVRMRMLVSQAALRLKALRESAGLSIRKIADELGISSATYAHYEYRYKEPFLPAAFALRVTEALARHGIPRDAVMALATPAESAVPADHLNLGTRYAALSPKRQRLIREFLEALEEADKASPEMPQASDRPPD